MPSYLTPGVYVEEVPSGIRLIAGVATSTAGFVGLAPDVRQQNRTASLGEPQLCTSFSDFKRSFGDFSSAPEQNRLAHAVFGFFNNGGTRCGVVQARVAAVRPAEFVIFRVSQRTAQERA